MTNNIYPSKEECYEILNEYGTPKHVIRHCSAVADVAVKLSEKLNSIGHNLNVPLIMASSMLHDIARTSKNHAQVGRDYVKKIGHDIAEIIGSHMEYDFPNRYQSLNETDIVCLADRMVKEDSYVGFNDRMKNIIERFKDDEKAVKIITENAKHTRNLIDTIEDKLGENLDGFLSDSKMQTSNLLLKVEKPGRYIGNELYSADKKPSDVTLRFGFAFPDLYEIGMSYTGLQIIYHILNSRENIFCERVFAPAEDMEGLLRENNLPLFTLETMSDVKDMDILGFTLQYELSYSNIINMINLAGIPVRSRDRDDSYPLLIAGGPCAFNPEPLAGVFDAFLIGDGEEILLEFCDLYERYRDGRFSKDDFLKEAASISGVYVPSLYNPVYEDGEYVGYEVLGGFAPERVKKRILDNLDDESIFPDRPIVPLIETVHNRAVMEIFRGCSRGCRFCQAGMIYRPVRERTQNHIKEKIYKQLDSTGYDEVSLLSLSSGDYSGIEVLVSQLMDELTERDVSLSLPSLRLDNISPEVLQKIGEYRKSSLTFAPEAGTQRLRDVINKNITEKDILNGVEKALELSWNKVKFYFMIGLPTETYEDLDGIVDIAEKVMAFVRERQEKGRRNFNLTVSVSNFIPKPNTPFQWCSGNAESELIEKNYYLKDRLKRIKGVNFQYHDTRPSHIEMLLAKGDRKTLDAIVLAVEKGCKFDSWSEKFKYDKWTEAFTEVGINMEKDPYTDSEKALPWDVIDPGVSKGYLKKEYERALDEAVTQDCREGCTGCGLVCK